MSASPVLDELATAGIRLWLDGERVRYDAPQGTMTPERVATIREHKAEILAALAAAPVASAPPTHQTAPNRTAPEPLQAAAGPIGTDWWVIEWPADINVVMAVLPAQWRRLDNGTVQAWYRTLDEVRWCAWAAGVPCQTCEPMTQEQWREECRQNAAALLAEIEALPEMTPEQAQEAAYYRQLIEPGVSLQMAQTTGGASEQG